MPGRLHGMVIVIGVRLAFLALTEPSETAGRPPTSMTGFGSYDFESSCSGKRIGSAGTRPRRNTRRGLRAIRAPDPLKDD